MRLYPLDDLSLPWELSAGELARQFAASRFMTAWWHGRLLIDDALQVFITADRADGGLGSTLDSLADYNEVFLAVRDELAGREVTG
jgi:hypothetical protein